MWREFTPESYQAVSQLHNWWTDGSFLEVAEGSHIGARAVNQGRQEFLRDFAARMLHCKSPAAPKTTFP
jgi:hypothetical protein